MKVTVIPASEMDESLSNRWREIQAADPALASPFFCPEFTTAAAECYPNIMVGIIEESDRIIGFLPFQRQWGGAGRPVALGLCDYQGIVVQRDAAWSARDLVKQCRLSSMEFDYLIASQAPFLDHRTGGRTGHVIDLREGYEQYRRSCKYLGGNGRKHRHVVKDLGPLRMEVSTPDPSMLGTLIQLKREQYARTSDLDPLEQRAVRRFLERVQQIQTSSFAGMLSTLYAGDALIAAHFGMRSATVWHWWFPVYVPSYGRYSPGLLLLERTCQAAGDLGLRALDLGGGDEPYKLHVANDSVGLVSGRIGASWPAMCRRCLLSLKQHVRDTRLVEPARLVRGRLRHIARIRGKW